MATRLFVHCCIVSILLAGVAVPAIAQGARDLSEASEVRVYKNTDEADLKAYIYNPDDLASGERRGAILFFHGGGWRSGNPDQFAPHCALLASKGMIAITAEYRLTKKHGTPAWRCVEDAKSAMRWVRAHAADLGIDPDRIAVGGGSAGGHLAACIGLGIDGFDTDGEDSSVRVSGDAMVLFNPAVDIAQIPERYGWDGRNADASPLQLVKPGAPPAIVFHGTADTTVPHDQAVAFTEAMTDAGNQCRLESTEDAGHGFFNFGRGDGSAYTDTTRSMVDFLEEHGFLDD